MRSRKIDRRWRNSILWVLNLRTTSENANEGTSPIGPETRNAADAPNIRNARSSCGIEKPRIGVDGVGGVSVPIVEVVARRSGRTYAHEICGSHRDTQREELLAKVATDVVVSSKRERRERRGAEQGDAKIIPIGKEDGLVRGYTI